MASFAPPRNPENGLIFSVAGHFFRTLLGLASHPKTTSSYPGRIGKGLLHTFEMLASEKRIAKEDLEGRIKREERLKHVLFRPETVFIHDKSAPTFQREKNVVNMNNDTGSQARKDLEE